MRGEGGCITRETVDKLLTEPAAGEHFHIPEHLALARERAPVVRQGDRQLVGCRATEHLSIRTLQFSCRLTYINHHKGRGSDRTPFMVDVSLFERAGRDPQLATIVRLARGLKIAPADLVAGIK